MAENDDHDCREPRGHYARNSATSELFRVSVTLTETANRHDCKSPLTTPNAASFDGRDLSEAVTACDSGSMARGLSGAKEGCGVILAPSLPTVRRSSSSLSKPATLGSLLANEHRLNVTGKYGNGFGSENERGFAARFAANP